MAQPRTTSTSTACAIAVRRQAGRAPGIVWLGGFRSDMTGTKAETLAGLAADTGPRLPAARLFRPRRIRRRVRATARSRSWLAKASPCSAASRRPRRSWSARPWAPGSRCAWCEELRKAGEGGRIAGLVLLAPAPDFTTELIEPAAHQEAEEGAGRKGLFRGAVGLFAPSPISTRARCSRTGGEPRA